jgi:hypothetical protein
VSSRNDDEPDASTAIVSRQGAIGMNASFDIDFSQHEDRIRRAEQRFALIAATKTEEITQSQAQPRHRRWTLLRRIAGTPAAA